MRVLVVGGSGLVGREVVGHALAAGHEVAATSTGRAVPPHPDAAWSVLAVDEQASMRSVLPVAELVRTWRPEAVINTAYVQHGPLLGPVTELLPAELARLSARTGARLVHVSTDVVFDGSRAPGEAYVESDEVSPAHEYGRAKARAEVAVARADPGAAIVRSPLLVGGRMVDDVVAAAAGERAMTFYTDEIRSVAAPADLARFLLLLATDADSTLARVAGPVHAAGPEAVDRFTLALAIARSLGAPTDRLEGGPSPVAGPPRPRNCSLRSERSLPGLPLARPF